MLIPWRLSFAGLPIGIYGVGNTAPGLGQTQNYGGITPLMGSEPSLDNWNAIITLRSNSFSCISTIF
jgi:hypothetical protein